MPEISPELAKKLEDGDPDVEEAFYQLLQVKNSIAAELDECRRERDQLRAKTDSQRQ